MDTSIKAKKNKDIAFRVIGSEALLVNPKDGLVYPLNCVGTRVWELIDAQRSAGDIVRTIEEEFDGEKACLEKDILEFIGELIKTDLASAA
jgi:hypothetical protein